MIDKNVVNEYLKLAELDLLDPKKYEVVNIIATEKQKFINIENS